MRLTVVSLDPSKASGPGNIVPRIVLQHCANHYLSPLKYGVVPEQWRLYASKVTSIFKSGDPCSMRYYHPISLLSNTSKVLEHLIYDKMIDYVGGFISFVQNDFLRKWSSLQQMLLFLNYIYNFQSQTDVLYSISERHLTQYLMTSFCPHCGWMGLMVSYGPGFWVADIRESLLTTIYPISCQ